MRITVNQIRFIKSLHQKKFRDQNRLFIAEGPKIIDELLESDWKIRTLAGSEQFFESRESYLTEGSVGVIHTNSKELERISLLKSPNDVIALVEYPEKYPDVPSGNKGLILVLDGIQDPGNMGTIIRTADWFGISQVICSPDTVDLFNPKVVQASMGSFTRVNITYQPPEEWIRQAGIPTYGAAMDG